MSTVSRFFLLMVALVISACSSPAAPTAALVSSPPQEATTAPTVESSTPATEPVASNAQTFALVDGSFVLFKVDEVLNGTPTTVVGQSDSASVVEGAINLDFANPAAVTLSPVKIDLRSLATDNNFRNRSMHDLILQTGNDTNRYAQFEATGFSELPESVSVGQTYQFQITGNITIHGTTLPLTFNAQMTPVSDTRLEGSATVTTQYELFGIQILRLPQQVAAVYKDVILEINFIAEVQ